MLSCIESSSEGSLENVGFPDNQPSISSQSQSRSLPHSALSSHTPRTGPVSSRTLCNYMHFEICDILLVLVVPLIIIGIDKQSV